MSTTCYVCIESVKPENLVTCLCSFAACPKCVSRYLLESTQDPHCMKCKVAWNTEFLVKQLGKDFVYGAYKVHRQDVLYDRERARFPEALEVIQEEIEQAKQFKLLAARLTLEAERVKQQLDALPPLPALRQVRKKDSLEQGKKIEKQLNLIEKLRAEKENCGSRLRAILEEGRDQPVDELPGGTQSVETALAVVQRRVARDVRCADMFEREGQYSKIIKVAVGIIPTFPAGADILAQLNQRAAQAGAKTKLQAEEKAYHRYAKLAEKGTLNNFFEKKEKARIRFIRACPGTGCRGMLTPEWLCPLCCKESCSRCQEIKESGHKCLPESLATAKLLNQDSKPCPGCAALIFKIEGCDQMFCTQCTTAFSWNTGQKETGIIHNPHFYEYQRQRAAGAPALDPCGQFIPDARLITQLFADLSQPGNLCDRLLQAHSAYGHNGEEVLRLYDIGVPQNLPLRVQLLKGEIDELKFKDMIQRRDKDYRKRRDYHGILITYHRAHADILQRLEKAVEKSLHRAVINLSKQFSPFLQELDTLREEFNQWLSITAKYYDCLPPYIHADFKIYKSINYSPQLGK